jgi:hypothetical protein
MHQTIINKDILTIIIHAYPVAGLDLSDEPKKHIDIEEEKEID